MANIHYLIPARRGSKGLPFKNRKLFNYTLNSIPKDELPNVTVSTDDEYIISECNKKNISYIQRSYDTANDTASMKTVAYEFIKKKKIGYNDTIIILYLTYPERKWDIVKTAITELITNNNSSVLCKQPIKSHPYLCMYDLGNGLGKQVVKHNKYRRQDYPECFEISHYICGFKRFELNTLNSNLYNKRTKFINIDNVIDVDTPDDLNSFIETKPISTNFTIGNDNNIELVLSLIEKYQHLNVIYSETLSPLSNSNIELIKNKGGNIIYVDDKIYLDSINKNLKYKIRLGYEYLINEIFKYRSDNRLILSNTNCNYKINTDYTNFFISNNKIQQIELGRSQPAYEHFFNYIKRYRNSTKAVKPNDIVISYLKHKNCITNSIDTTSKQYNGVLIIGNDNSVDSIDYNKISNDFLIVGINRIWKLFKPNILYFQDIDILEEIENDNYDTTGIKLITTTRILNIKNPINTKRLLSKYKVQVVKHPNTLFSDSVSTSIGYFSTIYRNIPFYLAGVSLKWNDNHHFWVNYNNVKNTHGKDWYEPRFKSIRDSIIKLSKTIEIISVTENSTLNSTIPYKKINDLYV